MVDYGSFEWPPIGGSGSSTTVNGLSGAVVLVAGTEITLTPSGQNITIASTDLAAALLSINADVTAAQTLSVGTAGTDFAITNPGSGSHVFNLPTSSASNRGALSSTDWSTFNGKQAAGSYITALTGAGTASGPGSATLTLATVNANVGTFGSSTSIPTFTVTAQGLITAASGNVVIAPAGTLSGTTLNSTVVTSSLTSLGAQAQALNMNSHLIDNVTDPVSAQDAATKNYVDGMVSALQPATSVFAATTANIPGTYLNGVAGVGATFTTTATGVFTVDGVTPPLGARILIKNQSSGFQNGIYNITTLGSLGISTVFTRTLDYNTAADMNNAGLIPVINGTLNALSSWQQVAVITTVGTDALVFTEFTANPSLYLLKANNLSDVASASTSLNNLLPSQTSNSGKFLTTNGTNSSWGTPSGAGAPTVLIATAPTSPVTLDQVPISWGTTNVDTASAFNGTTYTAPTTGYYLVTCAITLAYNSGAYDGIKIFVNGSQVLSNLGGPKNATTDDYRQNSTLLSLTAGDTVTIGVATNFAGNTTLNSGRLTIHLVK